MSAAVREKGSATACGDSACRPLPEATLVGAATKVSLGIAHAIQHMQGLNWPVPPKSGEEVDKKKKSPSSDRPMETMTSLRKKLDSIFEEKKEDPFCGYDCSQITEPGTPDRSLEDSTYSATYLSRREESLSKAKAGPLSLPERSNNRGSARRTIISLTEDIVKGIESPSPMARMRNRSKQLDQDPTAPSSPPVQKTQEEIKAEQQRRWKSKMKIVHDRKKKERIMLNGGSRAVRRKASGNGSIVNMIGNQVLELIDHQCGAEFDVVSESEDSGSVEEDSDPSFYGNRERRAGRLDKKRQQRKKLDSEKKNICSHQESPDRGSEKSNNSELSGENEFGRGAGPIQPSNTPPSPVSTRIAGNLGEHIDPLRFPSTLNATESGFVDGKSATIDFPHFPPSRGAPISEISNNCSRLSDSMDMTHHGFVQAFVRDMVRVGFSFLWQKETMTMHPTTVALRMKLGYRTPKGTYCGPRVVWKESEFETYGVNLLDIQILERASPVQLRDYPYAIPSRTVYLLLNRGQEFVFEAPSEKDAYRFIHGMKWLVARLTFNLVIGNMDVVAEILDFGASKLGGDFMRVDDSRRRIAMDDMAEHLVERSVLSFPDDVSEDSI